MKNYIITNKDNLFFDQDTDGFSPSILDATLFEQAQADELVLSMTDTKSEIITTYLSRKDLHPLGEKLDNLKMAVLSVPLTDEEKKQRSEAFKKFIDSITPIKPSPNAPKNITIAGLLFKLTCSACPEQYDVFDGDKKIGYVRLRHGSLSVDNEVIEKGIWHTDSVHGDGEFDDQERPYFLAKIAFLLLKEFNLIDSNTNACEFDNGFNLLDTPLKPLHWIDEAEYHFSHCLIGDFFITPIDNHFQLGFYQDDYLTQEKIFNDLEQAKKWANEHYIKTLQDLLS